MIDPERDELVSAYLDGEVTPEERSRVESDPILSERAEELRRAAEVLATPVEPVPAMRADAAVRRALGTLPAAVIDVAGRRQRTLPTRWIATAAAVLALLAVGASLLRLSDRGNQRATRSSGEAAALGSTGQGVAGVAAEQAAATADLGSFADDASLAAAARSALAALAAAPSAAASRGGGAPDGAPPTGPMPLSNGGGTGAQASCAEPDPAYGAVVLDAPATLRGTHVRVIVQRTADGAQQLSVLAGCDLILRRPL